MELETRNLKLETRNLKPVSVLMCAIGGYGYYYLKTLFDEVSEDKAVLCGVIDPEALKSKLYEEVVKRKVPVFSKIEEFYDSGNSADLVVISSPIHYHAPQSIVALKNGSNVLCDKPAGSTVQEVLDLIRIKNECGKWVEIGYQWSFTESIQSLKKDILSGIFGEAIRLKSLCFWPRGYDYYDRNNWTGRITNSDGKWIIDHPANNAFAHFIHNMLFLNGENMSVSAVPASVAGELYKAYDIQNGDTVACRIVTDTGVELFFYGSHTTESEKNPVFEFEFEKATISFDEKSREITAICQDGKIINYGSPDKEHQFLKLFQTIESVNNKNEIICGPETALAQTICANGIQESNFSVTEFPDRMIIGGKNRRWVKGLEEDLIHCYEKNILPAEGGFEWAKKAGRINLLNYKYFPGIE